MESFSYGSSDGDYGNVWKQENYNMYPTKTDGGYPLLKEEHVQGVPDHYVDGKKNTERNISFMGFNQNELFIILVFVVTVLIFAINMNNRIGDLERRLEMLMVLSARAPMVPPVAMPQSQV